MQAKLAGVQYRDGRARAERPSEVVGGRCRLPPMDRVDGQQVAGGDQMPHMASVAVARLRSKGCQKKMGRGLGFSPFFRHCRRWSMRDFSSCQSAFLLQARCPAA